MEIIARFEIRQTDLTSTTHHLLANGVLNAVEMEVRATQEAPELIAV